MTPITTDETADFISSPTPGDGPETGPSAGAGQATIDDEGGDRVQHSAAEPETQPAEDGGANADGGDHRESEDTPASAYAALVSDPASTASSSGGMGEPRPIEKPQLPLKVQAIPKARWSQVELFPGCFK